MYDDDPAQFVTYALRDLVTAMQDLSDPEGAWRAFLLDFFAAAPALDWRSYPLEQLAVQLARRWTQEIRLSL